MLKKLLWEYKQSLRFARQMKKKLQSIAKPTLRDQEDITIINSMISDLEYEIEWLISGRNPDARRGIDKNGVYLTDPAILDVLPVHQTYKAIAKNLSDFEKELIEDALCTLSEREKDAFLMIKVEGLTFEYAAELMGIKKTSVQNHVERAIKKIEHRKKESLFLVS
ncbi:Fis family transcriptional regulator [Bacillus idriensis]|uniref:Fis family transcriptional regulator n=1 Tax=Metabacillus idriensis TaxID=324768 RepID=A0A6I2M9M6_9BACI|nr:sigma factor-like helix-turn-helix DNA-binding protein [Metabacillus idriensis]MRX54828.1 Fis family transcriptional regulator [Metabacillus idriensis]